jgi:hypothetical protein
MKVPLLLLLLAGSPLACLAADTLQPAGPPPFAWVDPDDAAVAAVRQSGEQCISRVANLLIFEVERSLSENGLAKTLEVVHLKNLALPKASPGQPRVTAIKRTSRNLRNPANEPDAADRAALDRINTAIQEGAVVPALLIQRLESTDAPVEWRVYRPITTMPLCLKCHGPQEELQPVVRAFLAAHYPKDNAVNLTAYQWRGVIRVSLATAEPAPPVKTR